ncbi:MAG TPA: LysM peptidoglycan-binding domain-containing protein [Anaerolineales bacterium]|jgi:WD40 repeat protein/LysM repeat protein
MKADVEPIPPTNPYVGPRSIKVGEAFYGRDREIRSLSALLISERIVLLHSPSGAGKSSLIQAGLMPRMAERFSVFPLVRVNLEPPEEVREVAGLNRYLLSTLLSLEESLPAENRLPLSKLAGLTLAGYLEQRALPDESLENSLFLFDQFEEVLTVSPTDAPVKQAFFEQLGEVLQNRRKWALFAIREDYMGGLAPYVRVIPNRLADTFRLGLLGPEAARLAIQQPARDARVNFTDEAAEKLVDDLRRIQVQQPDGSFITEAGPNVEPVQLQVVCFNLWQSQAADDKIIDEGDLQRVGSVDQALASYYAKAVHSVSESGGLDERFLRQWFDQHLITQNGIRSQVLKGAETTEELPNTVLRLLENTHLVRGETRAGKTWYELSHDRLVKPVRQDNTAWFEQNLSLLQRQSVLWIQQGRSEGLLLRGKALEAAEKELGVLKLIPDETAFLKACRELRDRERKDVRQRQFIIAGLIASLVLLVVAIFFGISANTATQESKKQAQVAQTSQANAESAKSNAETARSDAVAAKSTAVANEADAKQQKSNAEAASRRAFSGQLALASKFVASQYPQRSQLLGLEALRANLDAGETANSIAEEALRAANERVNGRGLPGFSREVSFLTFTNDNRWLMAGSVYSGEFHAWNISEMDKPDYTPFKTTVPIDNTEPTPFLSEQQNWFVIDLGTEKRLWFLPTLQAGTEPVVLHGDLVFLAGELSLLELQGDKVVLWRFDTQHMPQKTSYLLEGKYSGTLADQKIVLTTSPDKGKLAWDTTKTPPQIIPSASSPNTQPNNALVAIPTASANSPKADPWPAIPRKGFEDQVVVSATSPNLQWHAEGAYGGSLRLWNLVEEEKYRISDFSPNNLEFSSDGQWMVSGSELWHLQAGLPSGLPVRFSQSEVRDGVFSPDGRWLVFFDGDIKLLNLTAPSGNIENLILSIDSSTLGRAYWFNFSPGSRWLVVGGRDFTGLWDLTSPQTTPLVKFPVESLSDLIFTQYDKYLVGWKTSGTASEIRFLEFSAQTDQFTTVGTLKLDQPFKISPNGSWLITSKGELYDLTCIIKNISCKPFILESFVTTPDFFDFSIKFSPDSRYLTSSFSGKTFQIWDLQAAGTSNQSAPKLVYDKGTKYYTYEPVWETIQPVTRRIYLFGGGGGGGGGEPGSYKIDYGIELFVPGLETPIQSLILRGHEEPVERYLTSPSSHWTVTISTDSIKLWDLPALRADPFAAAVELPLDTSQIRKFGFTVDERWLVLNLNNKNYEFLPLHLDDLMAQACRSVGRNFIINEWQRYFLDAPYHRTCENLPEHQSVQIELRLSLTATPTITPVPENGSASTSQPTVTSTPEPKTVQVSYTVKEGDNLYSIAFFLGTDVQTLMRENNLTNPNLILVGRVLVHNALAPTPTPTLGP